MKNSLLALILAAVLVSCGALSFLLLGTGGTADRIEIWSQGELKYTLSLKEDRILTVETESGTNTVTIKDGAVAVTAADCPDHYCMHRGYCSGGAEIVCLPNRLVIRFLGEQKIDGVVG